MTVQPFFQVIALPVGDLQRRVTLGDAAQLDVVPLAELDIAGRVRLHRPDYPDVAAGDWVIGAHDGTLALAQFERRRRSYLLEVPLGHLGLTDDTAPIVCGYFDEHDDFRGWRVEFQGQPIWLAARDVRECRLHHGATSENGAQPTEHHEWEPRGAAAFLRAELPRRQAAEDAEAAAHAKAAAARLIVLGGWS